MKSFEGEAMTEERVRELVHAELTEYHDETRREEEERASSRGERGGVGKDEADADAKE